MLEPSLLMILRSSHAFSLLEILVALTLFAVVVMATLDLWPAAQKFARETEQKTTATLIAERIAETLKATAPNGIVAIGADWMSNLSHCIALDLKNPSEHYLAYDAGGEPQRELTAAEYQNSLKEENVTSVAFITIKNNLFPGLADVSIVVATPASFPDKQRHHAEFAFLLSTSPKEKKLYSQGWKG